MSTHPAEFAGSFLAAEADPAPTTLPGAAEVLKETLLKAWGDFVAHLPYLAVGLVVVGITWLAASLTQRLVKRALRRTKWRESLRDLLGRFAAVGIWVAGLLLAAIIVFPGLSPAKALGGLGLLSVAVGFAFRDIFENFFAGILLLWRYPFERGDFVECEGITGKIENISLRMSEIRKTSGELVVVPNSVLFSNAVDVLTDLTKRRVTIMAGVSYDTDVPDAVEVIERAVKRCGSVNQGDPVQIFVQGFGSSSIEIEVTWWTAPKPVDIRRSRNEVVTAVKGALDDAGIEIPFPYRTLTFKGALPVCRDRSGAPEGDSGQ